mmetsp:Transcript_35081/g.47909  ORF Transcript_35081/g.47909 Transcript_35081/m.47909 type:complete len:523 (-) Transcript_35081:159-1727(-)|eukprot:CAMPEP_0201483860 /NCGR_PEP_ID=MMETSP0151_2-20130828/8047_1 /ASSEMBLY_ACC=CAM_ASM_000257 /TAXON_ID=200890 /ORGANISM="Paramoeba atlantica, Strain 621/1 / CCAP 1560/9" /LENGTH=522 /DNA_ID=CAMNT_0047867211 /DNA_START=119 /DNA_END=1687 /DNA_ORIENTATION=+
MDVSGVVLKLSEESGVMKRVKLPLPPSMESVRSLIRELFPNLGDCYELSYLDEDGDRIVVSVDCELLAAIEFSRGRKSSNGPLILRMNLTKVSLPVLTEEPHQQQIVKEEEEEPVAKQEEEKKEEIPQGIYISSLVDEEILYHPLTKRLLGIALNFLKKMNSEFAKNEGVSAWLGCILSQGKDHLDRFEKILNDLANGDDSLISMEDIQFPLFAEGLRWLEAHQHEIAPKFDRVENSWNGLDGFGIDDDFERVALLWRADGDIEKAKVELSQWKNMTQMWKKMKEQWKAAQSGSQPSPSSSSSTSVPDEKAEEEKDERVVHPAICDVCEERIVGIRFKCFSCPDYDLCEKCEQKAGEYHDPSHPFLKMTKPEQRAAFCPRGRGRNSMWGRGGRCGRGRMNAQFINPEKLIATLLQQSESQEDPLALICGLRPEMGSPSKNEEKNEEKKEEVKEEKKEEQVEEKKKESEEAKPEEKYSEEDEKKANALEHMKEMGFGDQQIEAAWVAAEGNVDMVFQLLIQDL